MPEDEPLQWNFGQLESALASMHGIDGSKRTAFQSRLKNFHRLGFPFGFKTSKGKTAFYSAGQVVQMALAVEMTQLGLSPDRTLNVIGQNRFATMMAVRLAARSLVQKPDGFDERIERPDTDPLSMFIFFDPAALAPLMMHLDPKTDPDMDQSIHSFFYGGAAVVRENIVKWTSGQTSRLSLINITATLDNIAKALFENVKTDRLELRKRFFLECEHWTNANDEMPEELATDFIWGYLEANPIPLKDFENLKSAAEYLEQILDLPADQILEFLEQYGDKVDASNS